MPIPSSGEVLGAGKYRRGSQLPLRGALIVGQADFEDAWAAILLKLPHSDRRIKPWSAAGRISRSAFFVSCWDVDSVTVTGGGIDGERRISKSDFADVFSAWPEYCAGTKQRSELRERSLNSTWVISILHWLEEGST